MYVADRNMTIRNSTQADGDQEEEDEEMDTLSDSDLEDESDYPDLSLPLGTGMSLTTVASRSSLPPRRPSTSADSHPGVPPRGWRASHRS